MTRLRLRLSKQPQPGEQSSRWDWLRRYRTWEANRKVVVYPENWLEPEAPVEGESKHETTVGRRPDDES